MKKTLVVLFCFMMLVGTFVFADETKPLEAIALTEGGKLEVNLIENATTGYTWHYVAEAGVTIVEDAFIPPNAGESEALVGAAGKRHYLFTFEEAGEWTLLLQYYRDWEPEQIAQEHELLVKVSDQGETHVVLDLYATESVEPKQAEEEQLIVASAIEEAEEEQLGFFRSLWAWILSWFQ